MRHFAPPRPPLRRLHEFGSRSLTGIIERPLPFVLAYLLAASLLLLGAVWRHAERVHDAAVGATVRALATELNGAALAAVPDAWTLHGWRMIEPALPIGLVVGGGFLFVALLLGRSRALAALTARRNEELLEAMTTAEQASRAKSEFLANMSHELRTPLNAIIGFSDIMAKEQIGPIGTPRYREYAGDINACGAHLLSIINDILDMAKIEAGKVEMRDERLALPALFDCCLRLMRERADASGVTLRTRLAGDLPLLCADSRALKQILLNLLANAVKFTPRSGLVGLTAEVDAERGELVVAVADTGCGIAGVDLERIFLPFVQVDGGLARRHEGAGLGLAIVKALAEKLDARIDVASALGRGTTVSLRFPRERLVDPLGNRRAA